MPNITAEGWIDFSPIETIISKDYSRVPLDYRNNKIEGASHEVVPFVAKAREGVGKDIYDWLAIPFGYVQIGDLSLMDSRLKEIVPNELKQEFRNHIVWLWNGMSAFWTTNHLSYSALAIQAMMSVDLRDKTVVELGCADGVLGLVANLRGAKEVVGVENDPIYEPFYRRHLEENEIDPNKATMIAGDFTSPEVRAQLLAKQIDVVAANIGPYYGNAHLDAIDVGTSLPTVSTYIDGAFSFGRPDLYPTASIEKISEKGFRRNFRPLKYRRDCYAYIVERGDRVY